MASNNKRNIAPAASPERIVTEFNEDEPEDVDPLKPMQDDNDRDMLDLGLLDQKEMEKKPADVIPSTKNQDTGNAFRQESRITMKPSKADIEAEEKAAQEKLDQFQNDKTIPIQLVAKQIINAQKFKENRKELQNINNVFNSYKRVRQKTRTQAILNIFEDEEDQSDVMNTLERKKTVPLDPSLTSKSQVSKSQIGTSSMTAASMVLSNEDKDESNVVDGAMSFMLRQRKFAIQEEYGFDIDDYWCEKEKRIKASQKDLKKQRAIKDSDDWKFWWDLFILIIAIWNSLSIPVAISFSPDWSNSSLYSWFDNLGNVLFFVDIFIAFNTSFFNADGEEITDRKQIALHYMKGMFVIDFISSVPFDLINKEFKVLSILKVVRISRLSKMINKLALTEESKAYIKIVQLIFILFLIMHLLGCSWYYIVAVIGDRIWVPPLDFIWAGSDKIYDFYEKDTVQRYFVSLYNAVLALGGNEMGPRSTEEIGLMIMILLGCAIVNANIFGEMTVLVQMGSKKSTLFQEQIDNANTAMKNIFLPMSAQDNVRNYLITTQGTHYEQQELQKFIDLISPSIREKVAVNIFSKIVMRNNRLKKFITGYINQTFGQLSRPDFNKYKDKLVFEIVYRMKTDLAEPDKVVIEQFSSGEAMYMVAKGECQVIVIDESSTQDISKKAPKFLRPGDYFGEISLIYGCKRTAEVIVKKYTTLARLDHEAFKELQLEMPELIDCLNKGVFQYSDRMIRFIKKSLRMVPYFAHIDEEVLFEIIFSLKTNRFSKGTIFQQPGDDATSLFFLQSGIIEIYTQLEGREFVLERLFRGSIINYRTFFMEEHGTLYLRFATQSVLQELPYETIDELNSKYENMNKIFQKYKLEIVRKGIPIPLDYIMVLPKRVNKNIHKEVRNTLINEKKEELNQVFTERRSAIQRQGFEISTEDEKLIQKTLVEDAQVDQRMTEAFRLENLLKNVVVQRLNEIREVKSQKSIKESVEVVIKQNAEKEAKTRIKIKKKLLQDYEDKCAANAGEDNDLLYNRCIIIFDRLMKILTAHSQAVDSLERKVELVQQKTLIPIGDVEQQNLDIQAAQREEEKLNVEGHEGAQEDQLYNSRDMQIDLDIDDIFSDQGKQEMVRLKTLANISLAFGKPNSEIMKQYRLDINTELQDQRYDSNASSIMNVTSKSGDTAELLSSENEEDGEGEEENKEEKAEQQ